jgi:hypothetical protein
MADAAARSAIKGSSFGYNLWRDLRVHRILEGASQIMQMIIGRHLLRD